MIYAAMTDTGKLRKSNQDSFAHPGAPGYEINEEQLERFGHLFIVCDGVGGHAAGDVASRIATSHLMTRWYSEAHLELPDRERLSRFIIEANDEIFTHVLAHPQHRGMATTLVAMLVRGSRALVANLGDSRMYLLRGSSLRQITVDHSLVQEMYEQGEIPSSELRRHPYKHIISNALGFEADPRIDLFELELQSGDLCLLCTDGLTDMLGDISIARILRSESSVEDKTTALVRKALDKGGFDNVTVIILVLANYHSTQ